MFAGVVAVLFTVSASAVVATKSVTNQLAGEALGKLGDDPRLSS